MKEDKMLQIASVPFIKFKAYKLLHRLCKEADLPRSRRAIVKVFFTPKYHTTPHMMAFNALAVNVKWCHKNLTKKEFAQFVKLSIL